MGLVSILFFEDEEELDEVEEEVFEVVLQGSSYVLVFLVHTHALVFHSQKEVDPEIRPTELFWNDSLLSYDGDDGV
jgi:hypothetical protein